MRGAHQLHHQAGFSCTQLVKGEGRSYARTVPPPHHSPKTPSLLAAHMIFLLPLLRDASRLAFALFFPYVWPPFVYLLPPLFGIIFHRVAPMLNWLAAKLQKVVPGSRGSAPLGAADQGAIRVERAASR